MLRKCCRGVACWLPLLSVLLFQAVACGPVCIRRAAVTQTARMLPNGAKSSVGRTRYVTQCWQDLRLFSSDGRDAGLAC
jgi:hypothetical protein